MTKTYDSKSYELAEHFLSEQRDAPNYERLRDELAKEIQQTVEDFIVYSLPHIK